MFPSSSQIYKTCLFKLNVRHLFRKYHSAQHVRVRFAPSPTGYLHLGGLRTALYNYLFAKLNRGIFILRIEDTDQNRLVEGAVENLQNDLEWAGIKIDEGPRCGGSVGPYVQSQRLHLYSEQVNLLIKKGFAYRCFCTEKRLELLRVEAMRSGEIPKYDNRCRHLSEIEIEKRLVNGKPHCVRFKLDSECDHFNDLIYGPIQYDITANEGDPVIMKSDGFPTYHIANVIDDHFMNITHVLRGIEWQISTTKHLAMYKAFDWEPPQFGHLPLLLNADGTKLSKRQGDIKILHYRENGIMPQALINFIINSGGGFAKDFERGVKPKCYSMQELASQFNIDNLNTHSGKLSPERLLEFNKLEIERQMKCENNRQVLVKEVRKLIKEHFKERKEGTLEIDNEYIDTILKWSLTRINKLSDLISKDLMFIWVIPDIPNETFDSKQINVVTELSKALNNNEIDISKQEINKYFKDISAAQDLPFSKVMKFLRMILSGLKEGPSVAEMIEILGKENTLKRLTIFLNKTSLR